MINESFVFLHSFRTEQMFASTGTDLINEHFDIHIHATTTYIRSQSIAMIHIE